MTEQQPISTTNGMMIATPCYGNAVTRPYFESMWNLKETLTELNVAHKLYTLGNESDVHRARNNCVDWFLNETDLSHLFFIDADIEFTPDDAGKIWSMHTFASVASGCYRMKTPSSPFAAWVGGKLIDDLDLFGENPVKVDYAGNGFLMIHRDVFAAIKKGGDVHLYENSDGRIEYDYFRSEVVGMVQLPEDYNFCRLCKDAGFDIWMDPTVRLTHWGQIGYG